ncbi:MFS transporter [Campylobacter sp. JMF_04 NA10]|uniref:MFS transporter n=1 Tax=Campylobacter sp. JMF_04 NA10 TaxID=2983824 RepID=UPI0022E9B03F|nr:MFS transporter [Campylobacter sp. JMF_04 NA10]MDA3076985.1 MFS transporter [Campylobacter sp. JMF_04 NA10]
MLNTILPLSFIAATRFFGLFILLPVLSYYALELRGADEKLVGVLIGVYAIMQMLLQTPFGALSDKIGRKNTIAIGLVIFIAGSVICAFASDIYTMILGRFVQGCGAIGAVATALISDFTTEENRGKAMAIMGAMIGCAFGAAMILSPVLSAKFGLASLFWLSVILTIFCLILLFSLVPAEPKIRSKMPKKSSLALLRDKNLSLLNLSNFFQKAFMTTAFFLIPIMLHSKFGFAQDEFIKVYGIAMIFGFLSMGASGAMGEKRGLSKQILLLGILFFIVSYLIFAFANNPYFFIFGVIVFFAGFNAHEPIMQSLASKFAKTANRGEALGIFTSFGFFGSFIGGVCGGVAYGWVGILGIGLVVAVLGAVWFAMILALPNPKIFKNLYFDKALNFDFNAISGQAGIVEIYENGENFVVKYNSKIISTEEIKNLLGATDAV